MKGGKGECVQGFSFFYSVYVFMLVYILSRSTGNQCAGTGFCSLVWKEEKPGTSCSDERYILKSEEEQRHRTGNRRYGICRMETACGIDKDHIRMFPG